MQMNWEVPAWVRWGASILIFSGFVYWIEKEYRWTNMLAVWRALDPRDLAVAFCLIGLGYVSRTARLFFHFRQAGLNRFFLAMRIVLWHNFFNNLLPMRSGEAAFPLLMQKYVSIPARDSIPALLWFRFLDLLFLLALSGIAFNAEHTNPILLGTGIFLAGLIYFLVLTARGRLLNRLNRRSTGAFKLLRRLISGIPENVADLTHSVLWTILTWSAKLLAFSWLLMKFAGISWPVALLGGIAGELSSVFPIHGIAGAGTYEAAVVAVLIPLGIQTAPALQAAINLHLFVLATSAVSVIPVFMRLKPRTEDQTKT